nr:hypothetical protein [Candidatus Sigynarchaeota archaeon]
MITSSQALRDMFESKFDLGLKHISSISDNTLVVEAREDKLVDVMDFLVKDCDARLVSIFVNDFVKRMDMISVFQLNHAKIRILVRRGIDITDKKIQSIAHLVPNAKYLERYQSRFLNLDFVSAQAPESSIPEKELSIPWTRADLNDDLDRASFHGVDGIFDPVLDVGSYVWSKNRQMQVHKIKIQPGHIHKGILKFSETLPPVAIPFVIARGCWKDKFHSILACCLAIEEANDVNNKIPHVARCWRAFGCELERIVNHHRFLSSWMEISGHSYLAKQNLDIVLDLESLNNKLLGTGDITPLVTPGGITFDPVKEGRLNIDQVDIFLHEYETLFHSSVLEPIVDGQILHDYASKGKVPKGELINAGISGPFLRASGIPFDARADFPYDLYSTGL